MDVEALLPWWKFLLNIAAELTLLVPLQVLALLSSELRMLRAA